MHFDGIEHHQAPAAVTSKIAAACKLALHETSTLADFRQLVAFYEQFPEYRHLVQKCMGRVVLILEIHAEHPNRDPDCPNDHEHMWDHNLNELRKLDMLGSVRELRIVMYNGCRRNLNLDIVIADLGLHPGDISRTEQVIFLGPGLFRAGEQYGQPQDAVVAKAEADRTAHLIQALCPNVTSLWHHLSRVWKSSSGLTRDVHGIGSELFMELHRLYRPQLTKLQIVRPFPRDCLRPFSDNLETLVVDQSILGDWESLPKIPISNLQLLEILHIINLPNWTIFRRNNKKALWFQNLKKLAFEFDKPDKNPKEIDEADSKDKDEDKPREKAEFPIIVKFDGKMRVAAKGVGNTIMALQNYFKNGQHSPMVLVDEPSAFVTLSTTVLQNAQVVQVNFHDGSRGRDITYTSDGPDTLFARKVGWVRAARFRGMYHPMPLVVRWSRLERLQLTPLLAEETSVLILLSQLWNLQMLAIDAFAMERHHLSVPEAGNHFADHRASLRWFDAAYRDFEKAKERNGGFSHPLVRLHIRSRKRLDISAVVSLVSYLPGLVELGVVREMISEVAMTIGGRALGQPEERFQAIKVCEFSMHDTEIDG